MKVICINDNPSKVNPEMKCPVDFGSIYEKTEDVTGPTGVLHYRIKGIHLLIGAFRFVPLSEIDETTFSREIKELVN